MKLSTIKKYTGIFEKVLASNMSLNKYCKTHNDCNYATITKTIYQLKKQGDIEGEELRNMIDLYNKIVTKADFIPNTVVCTQEVVDTDDAAEAYVNRDQEGKVVSYSYKIFRRNKNPLIGSLSCEEMNLIYRLYSYYGDNLTQRVVSRHFYDLSLVDFKRILRAFNITKASGPFAPHMYDLYSEDELRDMQLREKENSFLRKAEEDAIKNNEKLLKKYAQENIALKKQIKDISEFNITIPETITPTILPEYVESGQSINLYLSDIHLGAAVTTGALYKENMNYGFDEAKRRLSECLKRLSSFGNFDTINLVLMGDNVDCCGIYGKTASLTHEMPENMDVREQANKFLELMLWFITSIVKTEGLCSHINLYSVPTGNHGGTMEYVLNKTLMATVNAMFPNIQTTMWEDFFGVFKYNNKTFVITHGKADAYMKRGLPLDLNDKTKVMLYEFIHNNNIEGNDIHIVKGDLHSNALNSCAWITYRNVLSLFGASDYSNYNFSRNNYGVSYDLFIGDNLVRGTFENL